MAELFANPAVPGVPSAIATLTAAITDTTSTTISATAPPTALQGAGQFRILIDTEYMIANYESSTWTVTRGAEGSTPATHTNSSEIQHLLTAGALSDLPSALAQDSDTDIESPADGDTLVFSSPDGTWNNQAPVSGDASGPSGTPGANSGTNLTLPSPLGSDGYGLYDLTIAPGGGSVVTLTLPSVSVGASFVVRATQNASGGNTLAFAGSPAVVFPGIALSLNEQAFAENWISFYGALDDDSNPTWYGFPATSSASSSSNYLGVFGDGSDSAVVLDGTTAFNSFSSLTSGIYTLSRDVYATNLTVNSGVVLAPNNFRIQCAGTLTNSGTIGGTPNSPSGTNQATAVSNNFGTLGTVAGASGVVGTGAAGSKGAVGTGGTGGSGTAGSAASAAAGTISNATKLKAAFAAPFNFLTAQFLYGTSTNNPLTGGTGGTAGSGDSTNKGGAGGIGGTPVGIAAYAVVNNGTIQSLGGPGGSPTTGNVGGGGGGAGGLILIYSLSAVTGSGSLVVTGGALGTGIGSGTNGGTGGSGLTLTQVLS